MDKIEMTVQLPVKSARVYADWLSSEGHTEMTGGPAKIVSEVGSKHTAWDNYITGEIVELSENRLIMMTWRTTEFADDAENSQLQITFNDNEAGCEVTLNHWKIPEGDGNKYKDGWTEYYFNPMSTYYSED